MTASKIVKHDSLQLRISSSSKDWATIKIGRRGWKIEGSEKSLLKTVHASFSHAVSVLKMPYGAALDHVEAELCRP